VLTNASVNVAAGKTLTVGSLVVDDGGALTLNTEDSGTLAVTGNYTIPAAAKVFVEKGTLRLGGNGGAVGTDIQVYQDGTLDVRGSLTGNVTLSGATLTGSGSVNGFVLVGSSTVAPGVATPAILTVDSLGADVASTFAFDLGGTVAGVTYDQLKITGPDFDLGSAQLTLANAGGLVADSVLTIVMNAGGDVNFGMFSGLPSGSNINLGGGMSAQISYYDNPLTPQFEIAGANQTNVSLLVVPEPASAALLLGGLASMLGLRRRRRA
jgi:hypothetical protein